MLIAQVTVFQQANYLENFVQSTFDALPAESLTGGVFLSVHLHPFGSA